MKKVLVSVLGLSFFLAGCNDPKSILPNLENAVEDLRNDFAPDPQNDNLKNPIVARVGNFEIRNSDIRSRFFSLPPEERALLTSPQGRMDLLNKRINFLTLVSMARKSGIQYTPVYRRSVEHYKNVTLAKLYMNKLNEAPAMITDRMCQDYYNAHPAEFAPRFEWHASHILTPSMDLAIKATMLLKRKIPFEQVVKTMSVDQKTRPRGGKMDPLHQGMIDPTLEKTLLPLRVGQISEIIQTREGFHILRKDSQTLSPRVPFEKVLPRIRQDLYDNAIRDRIQADRKTIDVRIDEKALSNVNLVTPPKNKRVSSRTKNP